MKWLVGITFATSLLVMPAAAHAETAMDTKADIQKVAIDWMNAYNKKNAAAIDVQSWTRLSEQFFRFDMWSSAGVRLPSGEAAA